MTTQHPEPPAPNEWAEKKIKDLIDFSMERGDRLMEGHDLRDKLTTLEQRQALLIAHAQRLRRKVSPSKRERPETPNIGKNEQLFDMFAEKIAKKLSEIEKREGLDKKQNRPDLFGPRASS